MSLVKLRSLRTAKYLTRRPAFSDKTMPIVHLSTSTKWHSVGVLTVGSLELEFGSQQHHEAGSSAWRRLRVAKSRGFCSRTRRRCSPDRSVCVHTCTGTICVVGVMWTESSSCGQNASAQTVAEGIRYTYNSTPTSPSLLQSAVNVVPFHLRHSVYRYPGTRRE